MIVAFAQGSLGGVGFLIFGLPQPAFWGTVMIPASVIPVVGSTIIWGPAAVYLLFTGHIAAGVGLIIWGGVVVSVIDNILKPILVKGSSETPSIFILFSILGGLTYFGMIGFILGPLILSFLLSLLRIYQKTILNAGFDSQSGRNQKTHPLAGGRVFRLIVRQFRASAPSRDENRHPGPPQSPAWVSPASDNSRLTSERSISPREAGGPGLQLLDFLLYQFLFQVPVLVDELAVFLEQLLFQVRREEFLFLEFLLQAEDVVQEVEIDGAGLGQAAALGQTVGPGLGAPQLGLGLGQGGGLIRRPPPSPGQWTPGYHPAPDLLLSGPPGLHPPGPPGPG